MQEPRDPCSTLPNLPCPCPTSSSHPCRWVTIFTDIGNLPKHRVTLCNSTTNLLHSRGILLRVTLSNLPKATLAKVRLILPTNNLFQAALAILLTNNLLQATQVILLSQAPFDMYLMYDEMIK